MRGQRQGIRYTKIVELSKTEIIDKNNNQNERSHNILLTAYEMRNTMYTYQIGKFSYRSSWVNRYHIVIHGIYSNSAWVKPIKDITEVVIMLGRTRALKCMKLCGIRSKHQVLDNEASQAYKDAVQESGMIYQLVPPDYH